MSKIEISGKPFRQTIKVDGQEIRSAISARLNITPDKLPVLELDLISVEGIEVEQWGRIALDDKTKAALEALGWTPPQ